MSCGLQWDGDTFSPLMAQHQLAIIKQQSNLARVCLVDDEGAMNCDFSWEPLQTQNERWERGAGRGLVSHTGWGRLKRLKKTGGRVWDRNSRSLASECSLLNSADMSVTAEAWERSLCFTSLRSFQLVTLVCCDCFRGGLDICQVGKQAEQLDHARGPAKPL